MDFRHDWQTSLRPFVDAVGDAIVVSNKDGTITMWNPAAERIFGFSESDALGQSLDLITPEQHRQRHWNGYHKTMATGVTRYGSDVLRVPALAKDGRCLSIAFTVALLRDAEGVAQAIVAVIRDETRRWSEERQMRRRLAELEVAAAKGVTT